MATMKALREGLRANLDSIEDVQVSAYALAQPTPPGIHVFPGDVEYDQTMGRGLDKWTFLVQAFVSFTTDVGSQVLLDELLAPTGARSVKTALESDKKLGGIVADLHVTGSSGYRILEKPTGTLLVAEWSVQVWASN